MRVAYQGKQFEFLQKDMRRPDVKTIEEMIEQNFTLHILGRQIEFFSGMEFIGRLEIRNLYESIWF